MKKIKIKYFNEDYPRLEKIDKGDWIDLRVDSLNKMVESTKIALDKEETPRGEIDGDIYYKKGDVIRLGLGVAMKLPEGYEAILAPRSSTFKHWGLMQTNSFGVIDHSYCGSQDQWMVEFKAMRDGVIKRFERVCQFRIQKNQPEVEMVEVDELDGENRGGYGSSGTK